MSDVIDDIIEKSAGKMEVISDPSRTSYNLLIFPPVDQSDSTDDKDP
jgi:hypothetical protein